MIVKTNWKLNNAELFLKLSYIQSKEIWNKKYYKETNLRELENGKVRYFAWISTLETRRRLVGKWSECNKHKKLNS